MERKILALVDCNNFFASCERVFNPKLNNKPVIVLSNNDGCVIARSEEAKALGIKMGEPLFKCKEIVKKGKVSVHSSNFRLYGNFSERVMEILSTFSKNIEIYSIDEAFLDFTEIPFNEQINFAKNIRKIIKKWTGIPVSIGIGPTKTLAKLAGNIGKKYSIYEGVFNITDHPNIKKIFTSTKIEDIWGIGRQTTKHLNRENIFTVSDFLASSQESIKKNYHSPGLKTFLELNGEACIELEDSPTHSKSILSSRSFSKEVKDLESLKEAVASYVTIAATKLREQECLASYIQVFIRTNHHKDQPNYSNMAGKELPNPTDYTPELIKYAHQNLQKIFKKGFPYKKAGILLTGITPKTNKQFDLFTDKKEEKRQETIMKTVDELNHLWGDNTLKFAASGLEQGWKAKQSSRSPHYTTEWKDLLEIKI